MSTSLATGASRQALVLVSIAGLHLAAFVAISLGLGPPDVRVQPAPEILVIAPKPPKPVFVPPPDDVALPGDAPMPIPLPRVPLPDFGDDPDGAGALPGLPGASARAAAGLPVPAATAPRLLQRGSRLAAVIDACYPSASRRLAEEGRVVVRLTIDADGRPARWTVAQGSGFPRLDAAVECVVRRLEFTPGRRDGRAVDDEALLPIAFRMR
jgi:protein TonB